MIREVVIHTKKTDIPQNYIYDTETSDFYVYRHKYTGDEIHITKNPPLYVNIQPYINEVLDKIRAEIDEACKERYVEIGEIFQMFDRYKEGK